MELPNASFDTLTQGQSVPKLQFFCLTFLIIFKEKSPTFVFFLVCTGSALGHSHRGHDTSHTVADCTVCEYTISSEGQSGGACR